MRFAFHTHIQTKRVKYINNTLAIGMKFVGQKRFVECPFASGYWNQQKRRKNQSRGPQISFEFSLDIRSAHISPTELIEGKCYQHRCARSRSIHMRRMERVHVRPDICVQSFREIRNLIPVPKQNTQGPNPQLAQAPTLKGIMTYIPNSNSNSKGHYRDPYMNI